MGLQKKGRIYFKRMPFLVLGAVLALQLAFLLPARLAADKIQPAATVAGAAFSVAEGVSSTVEDTALVLDAAPAGTVMASYTVSLAPGRYLVAVNYDAPAQGAALTLCGGDALWTGGQLNKSESGLATGRLTVKTAGEITLGVLAGEGKLSLQNLRISQRELRVQTVARWLVGLLLADVAAVLVWLALCRGIKAKTVAVWGLLGSCGVFSCLPLLQKTLWHGSDLGYHLRRIETIADGLAAGQFPVRIQAAWLNGYGYATGVFYGDLFLYPAAVLRMLGLSIRDCYALYTVAAGLFTAFISYACLRRLLGCTRLPALAAAVAYTLAPYRLCNLYQRAALGEYTAQIFFPMILCAFAELLRRKQPEEDGKPAPAIPTWLLLCLGLSGVLQSHMLSTEMTVLALLVAALLGARRALRPATLCRILLAAGVFLVLNAGFLVPFLDYYLTGKFQINSAGGTSPIGANGAQWAQVLGFADSHGAGGLVSGMTLTPGLALWVAALLPLALAVVALAKRKPLPAGCKMGLALLAGGILTAWMSTATFPWDALYRMGGVLQTLVGSIQFPWRFIGLATILLCGAACAGLAALPKGWAQNAAVAALCLACVWTAGQKMQAFTSTVRADPDYFYGTEEANWQLSCGHYLPTENGPVDLNVLDPSPVWGDGLVLRSYLRQGATVTVDCTNTLTEPSTLQTTLLYYRGYTARDDTSNQLLPVRCGANNSAVVEVPAGYNGTFILRFEDPPLWRCAELCSLVTVCGLGLWLVRRKRGTGNKSNCPAASAEAHKPTAEPNQ